MWSSGNNAHDDYDQKTGTLPGFQRLASNYPFNGRSNINYAPTIVSIRNNISKFVFLSKQKLFKLIYFISNF